MGTWAGWTVLPTTLADDFERPPISYSASTPADRLARWLSHEGGVSTPPSFAGSDRQILEQLLAVLEVPVTSQVLVFARTSLQRRRIQPSHPRALYFSDDTYVGWVPGGLIEIASMDPVLGPIFYAVDPALLRRQDLPVKAAVDRDADCLRCHGGAFVRGIPSVFIRSVFVDAGGEPLLRHGSSIVDHRTPLEDRWGGWYVTGLDAGVPHRGNRWLPERADIHPYNAHQHWRALDPGTSFPAERYPRATSDIGALLVLEHQVAVHNALTRASHQSRRMLAYQADLQKAFQEEVQEAPVYESVQRVFDQLTTELVDVLLLKDEAPLPEGVRPDPEFIRDFESCGPSTPECGSLRRLQLRQRLFVHRCSPWIHSEQYLSLPQPLRDSVRKRLLTELSGTVPRSNGPDWEPGEREAIRNILAGTHPDFQSPDPL